MTEFPGCRYPRFALDVDEFLCHYWQQRPLLLRAALPDFTPPIDANQLAGLAMEDDVESRIVERSGETWALHHGPFVIEDFHRKDPWTLLVQGVDRLLPSVAALRQCVDFLPAWRFDDVMVSYASDGGSVGPHFDRYDVFLLQGEGQRLWRVGERCDDTTPRLDHEALNLLQQFSAIEEYLLGPGDVLYLPPGYAHWGIAQGDCTTFSLGFRAPPIGEMTARLADAVLERISPELLLEDRDSTVPMSRPGELTESQRRNATDAVLSAMAALDDGQWLGEMLTETASTPLSPPDAELPHRVDADPTQPPLWFEDEGVLRVFAAGEGSVFDAATRPLVIALCAGDTVSTRGVSAAEVALLQFLWHAGVLIAAEDLQ